MNNSIKDFLDAIKNSKYKYEIKNYIHDNNIDVKSLKQDLITEISKLNYNKFEKNIYSTTEKLRVAIWLLENMEENNLSM